MSAPSLQTAHDGCSGPDWNVGQAAGRTVVDNYCKKAKTTTGHGNE